MPFLSLKTKLVLAITAMVVVFVATLSTLYISQVVRQRIQDTADVSRTIGTHLYVVSKSTFDTDFSSTKIDSRNPIKVEEAWQEILQGDNVINSLLDSASGASRLVYDASIVDAKGVAILHTNPTLLGKTLEPRADFDSFVHAGIRKQIRAIYGPMQVYDTRIALERGGHSFGEVRIGVPTTFLRDELRPLLKNALGLSGAAILIFLVVAAGVSTLALRPLAAISQRLDLISSGKA